jgi:L-glutamine-phosphate cytidylyltransferase
MKVIILAAGEGKRLRPLTNNIPKCMVKLFGKSLLEWQLQIFNDLGIHDISIITGYKNDVIKFPNIKYFYNSKYDITNMIETLFCAKSELNDDIIISYGDIIFEHKVVNALLNSKHDISILVDSNWKKYWKLRFDNILEDAESLVLDSNNFITNIGQKESDIEKIQSQYIGLMRFQKKGILQLIKFYDNVKNESKNDFNPLNDKLPFEKSYMTDLLQGLINNGQKLKAVQINSGWLELDSISDYNLYNQMYNNCTLNQLISLNNS